MRLLGILPVRLPLLIAGKLSVALCWAALPARWWWPRLIWFRHSALDVVGAVILAAGVLLLFAGMAALGRSLRVGLATAPTELRTGGIYRLTRNPMYVGGELMCLAAVLWTANPMVAALAVVAVLVHHRIVLAEERHLAVEFGDQWTGYSRRVRRYL